MSLDNQDSSGEDLPIVRPTLIRELRNVLDTYPDDGQILKELIQNAEDAGASIVKVLTDKRTFNHEHDDRTLKRNAHPRFFQGPALCVYNDAEFSENDWEGIRMLHTSIKEKDPLKVGRFGLGFKSVFHLTDRLVILSGKYIMYMDPFKGEEHYCKRYKVSRRKGRELQTILHSLQGIFGVNEETFKAEAGRFSGTLFWFPLRQQESSLSSTVYAEDHLDNLLASCRAEASSLLLFLNHVERVTIYSRDGAQLKEVFSVGIASSCLANTRSKRKCFVSSISAATRESRLQKQDVFCVTEVTMETIDFSTSLTESQQWLIASFHCGEDTISPDLSRLCSNPQLSYQPYVGVAIPLTTQSNGFQSQVYCFLPLPLDTRSPTGLPVHVHGYFALEQNRRHLKWPTADQLRRGRNHSDLEPPILWNCLLVTELLPKVYCAVILRLQELSHGNPHAFFLAWPDVRSVNDRWRPVLEPLYADLACRPLFYSHTRGNWVQLSQAVLQRFKQCFSAQVQQAAVKVYAFNSENLVDLPSHVLHTLKEFHLLGGVKDINAIHVSKLIPRCLSKLSRSDRLNLLQYLSDHDPSLLIGQQLLPLANGQFGTFESRDNYQSSVRFWCPGLMIQLFPGLEAEFCDDNIPADTKESLKRLILSGILAVEQLEEKDWRIPGLLQRSLKTRFKSGTPSLNTSDCWVERVWNFLAKIDDLSSFSEVPLLPRNFLKNSESVMLLPLSGLYVCSGAKGMLTLPQPLASALTSLGVTVLHKLPHYVTSHRHVLGHFVSHPSTGAILKTIENLSLQDARSAVKTFNSTFNSTAKGRDEREALIQLLSHASCKIPEIFKDLKLFHTTTGIIESVKHVSCVAPVNMPSIPFHEPLLDCFSKESRTAAVRLGATELTLKGIVHTILAQLTTANWEYTEEDTITFMQYFLENKSLLADSTLLHLAKEVKFVKTKDGTLKKAADVYEPSPLLQELFHSQLATFFPSDEFPQKMLKKLKKLGQRTESNVHDTDLIDAARRASKMWNGKKHSPAQRIADGLWSYLMKYGETMKEFTLHTLSRIQCLPCLQSESTKVYPPSLPIKSTPKLVEPAEMCSRHLLSIVGSVLPTLKGVLSSQVACSLNIMQSPSPHYILQHLINVTQHYRQAEATQYRQLLCDIFQAIGEYTYDPEIIESLHREKCILVDSADQFVTPDRFWTQNDDDDIKDLHPYRFHVPVEMKEFSEVLEKCGSSQNQDDEMLLEVLVEIESKYHNQTSRVPDFRRDFQIVKQILDKLKNSFAVCERGDTLLPVAHNQPHILKFKPARECTVKLGSYATHSDHTSETYFYVHADIPIQTALNLGALQMKERALTGVEDLDFGYSQQEDLTTRLHGLLHDSYTDGFSVPKELVQNADDARASKVFFLLDERDNSNARTNLISDAMAGLQGPAIWAYNDAVFSDSDFANIIKLGGGTKKEDTSKVGRFGLGFNAVYNWTDVPCFLSRSTMAMFDPQRKYLDKGPGLKLDFTKPVNQDLLARMPEQFLPFQGVFGCHLQSGTNIFYNGTLFRFPLRTTEQANGNKLKSESYSEDKRREFLKMLLERAGSLLLFTQSVTEVQVFHLAPDSEPSRVKRLLTVRKACELPIVMKPQVQLGNKVILQFMKDQWSKKTADIQIQQKLRIAVDVTNDAYSVCAVKNSRSTVAWQVAWASGVNKVSAKMASEYANEGLVPLAAVAVSVSEEGGLKALKDSPQGFYKTGHLFCFLPLPEEQTSVTLPVHINGTFALTSDRRGLVTKLKEEFAKWDDKWNSALCSDAVCRAYLLALLLVRAEAFVDLGKYFDLWPQASVDHLLHSSYMDLVQSFYSMLMTVNIEVLPVPDTNLWVCFQDACFLQPGFRDSSCGLIAWQTLQRFWKGPGHIVDIPSTTCKLMKDNGPKGLFEKKVISELVFFKDFFFPNLHSEWWQTRQNDRDSLIHHALMKNDKEMKNLIITHHCIPCNGGQLRKPNDMVHPKGKVAGLYHSAEGLFPQEVNTKSGINFCDYSSLQRLIELGMIKDVLPWNMVLDRAESVGHLNAGGKQTECLRRAAYLLQYLSSMMWSASEFAFDKCPPDVVKILSQTAFLPVLGRPQNWPFEWNGDRQSDSILLSQPAELFSSSLKHLVACKENLLDTEALQLPYGAFLTGKPKEVLKILSVVVDENFGHSKLLESTVEQLLLITQHSSYSPNNELIQNVAKDIYSYLVKCLRRDEEGNTRQFIQERLCDKEIVWNGMTFVLPSVVAFSCPYNCSPYLYQLEASLQVHGVLFEAVGMKKRFDSTDLLAVLEKLKNEHADAQLPDNIITTVSQLAQLLADIIKPSKDVSLDATRIFLPDRHGILLSVSCLCVDDCPSLKESDRMKFVHDAIPVKAAKLLGVKSKRKQDYDLLTQPISVPFGQKEELTTRIRRLLQGYTFDASLCKELLQNAEDAGATESMFILDLRHLGTESVPENLEVLQGPALCFYNNKSFTKRDMEGIQNLGVGSKAHDALKIGQFGVGFNSVFHVTDVPSFWTREDDELEVICVLDPNCNYVPNTEADKPGVKFTDIDRVREAYPDFISGYQDKAIDMTQPGTLFRLPLRTEHMASSSRISQKAVTEHDIKRLLKEFQQEMHSSLLFLHNLRKVGMYLVQEDGSLLKQFEVSKSVDDASKEFITAFKRSLKKASQLMEQGITSVLDIPPFEVTVQSELEDSTGHKERWLAVHRVGFTEKTQLTSRLNKEWHTKNFRLLPRGGVAVKLENKESAEQDTQMFSSTDHKAFCILPLPVNTKLPMHVNGHFALDHETRRNLWNADSVKGDERSEWNTAIAQHIIVPAYISALLRVKSLWFPDHNHCDNQLARKLKQYHTLFPNPHSADSEFWRMLMYEIYKELARNELTLFPVTHSNKSQIEWMSVVKEDGFPGYFNNLISFFKDESYKSQTGKPVVLSQGISTSHTHAQSQQLERANDAAKEMLCLLKELNMKVLDAPFDIYGNFKDSGVENIQEATPHTVLQFLMSTGKGINGGCNIVNLPTHVSSTPLSKVNHVKKLVAFVSKDPSFLDKLDGLPLCLRQSERLHMFSHSDCKPIISKFSQLLPGSAEEFLHEEIRQYFRDHKRTHAVLQQLDIPMLASRLKRTLTDSCFSAGVPCVLDTKKLPFKSWIKDLWDFLQKQIEERIKENRSSVELKDKTASNRGSQQAKKADRVELRPAAEKMLQSLQEWCLIPVITGSPAVSLLYPVKMLHRVVHVTCMRDESNGRLWQILKKLPLPFLVPYQLPAGSIACTLVASLTHPCALLHALASCAHQFSASHEDGSTILDYFSKNLQLLQESCSFKKLKEEMLSLPVFPMINGKLGSAKSSAEKLCLSSAILEDGLMEWSCNRNSHVTLLREGFIPCDVCKFLEFNLLEDAEFYSGYLLPSIASLPNAAVVTHMKFIRVHFYGKSYEQEEDGKLKQLSLQLKSTAFIDVCGKLHRAQDFYTPFHRVFSVMCPEEQFPPKPYREREWKYLLVASGIISDVTDDLFLQFAREVEKEGSASITHKICKQSQVLVSHMFAQKNLTDYLLNQVRSIRFLLPSEWKSTDEGEYQMKIAPPFPSTNYLLSFCGSCFEDSQRLVWSSSDILHPYSDPRKWPINDEILKAVRYQLLQDKPPLEKVIQHAENICNSLGGDKGRDIFEFFKKKYCHKRQLIIVMEHLYQYLESNARNAGDLKRLKRLPLICDIDNRQMLLPAVVVTDLRQNEMIKGHIEKAPFDFGRYFGLFEKLGAAKCVTANHYVNVLQWLKNQTGDTMLDVEELKIVRSAVEGLFRCLRDGKDEQGKITADTLYLPTKTKRLQKSTEIIFKDDSFGDRFETQPDNMHFFLDFDVLEIKIDIPLSDINRLPKHLRMVLLSEVVQERICDEVLDSAEEGYEEENPIEDTLIHPSVQRTVIRLAYHGCKKIGKKFEKEDAHQIVQQLKNISVVVVSEVKTILTLYKKPKEETEREKLSFTHKIQGDERKAVVYVSVFAINRWERKGVKQSCLHSLYLAIDFVVQFSLDSYLLHSALNNPDGAGRILDEEHIIRCSFGGLVEVSVFPPAGDYVPIDHHGHLNNTFLEFYKGEHVGFEVFDPDVDFDGSDNDWTNTNGDRDAVYIYGIVRGEVCQNGTCNVGQLQRRYRVNLGRDRGMVEVSVIKMYKFVRPTSSEVDQYAGNNTTRDDKEEPQSIGDVLRKIRELLTEAWHLPDVSERRRVVKRMLLKWHPDKNPDNKEFCNRVTQAILHYVSLLESGQELPFDDDNTYSDVDSQFFNRAGSSFSQSFFTNMHARGRRYHESAARSQRKQSSRSGGYSSYRRYTGPNPQPQEGKRWFRQAKADVFAASTARQTCEIGRNWVCYLCHQAVEKALKALLFERDCKLFDQQSHDIPELAKSTRDTQLQDLACQLENQVGSHTRMRYPDVMTFPRVPVDVYTENDVSLACALATKVVDHVFSLTQG